MRTSVPFYGYTVYSPDYARLNGKDCNILRETWSEEATQWRRDVQNKVGSNAPWRATYHWRSGIQEVYYSTSTLTIGPTLYGWVTPTSTELWSDYAEEEVPRFPIPAPCTLPPIPRSECSSIQSSLAKEKPISHKTRWSYRDPKSEVRPGCTAGCYNPVLWADEHLARLFWWPTITTDLGKKTSNQGKTSVIAVFENNTYTSPTIYLSLATLHADNNCGTIGKVHTNVIVTIPTTATLTSLEGYGAVYRVGTQRPVNYEDFNQPIRPEVYRKLEHCNMPVNECGRYKFLTIDTECVCPMVILNGYTPRIRLPIAARTIDPMWANATLHPFNYITVTPVALRATAVPITTARTTLTSIRVPRATPNPGSRPVNNQPFPTRGMR